MGIKIYKNTQKQFSKKFQFKGNKIVLDCANGAGYKAAPKLLKELVQKL